MIARTACASDRSALARYNTSLYDRFHVPVDVRETMLIRLLDWKERVAAPWADVKEIAANLGIDDEVTVSNVHQRFLGTLWRKEQECEPTLAVHKSGVVTSCDKSKKS